MGEISWVVWPGSLSSCIDNVFIQDGCLAINNLIRGSAGEYQADEQAGVAGLSW